MEFYIDNLDLSYKDPYSFANMRSWDRVYNPDPEEDNFVKFPLKITKDGNYLKVKPKLKEMTREEVEKELGYKVVIKK